MINDNIHILASIDTNKILIGQFFVVSVVIIQIITILVSSELHSVVNHYKQFFFNVSIFPQ